MCSSAPPTHFTLSANWRPPLRSGPLRLFGVLWFAQQQLGASYKSMFVLHLTSSHSFPADSSATHHQISASSRALMVSSPRLRLPLQLALFLVFFVALCCALFFLLWKLLLSRCQLACRWTSFSTNPCTVHAHLETDARQHNARQKTAIPTVSCDDNIDPRTGSHTARHYKYPLKNLSCVKKGQSLK